MLKSTLFTHTYFPARRPGAEEKVLLVFHGLGDSQNGFTWMPPQLNIENLSYLLVNAPDDYYGGYSWFDFSDGGKFMDDALPGIRRSRELIRGLIGEMVEQGIKPANILLFGFSQGCLMAVDAGLRYGTLLGGICGVSGWVACMEEYPEAFSPVARQQKFLVTHGMSDPVLSFGATKAQCLALIKHGIDLTFRPYDKEHTILPEELAEIRSWLVERLGNS